ncbi:MAG: DEAD/DEAH box helicase [Carboxydocellales bacterium]
MQITITNNIRVRGAPIRLVAAITQALTIPNPDYVKRKQQRRPTWGCNPKLELYSREGADLILPRGFMEELLNLLPTMPNLEDYRQDGQPASFGPWNEGFTLAPDQMDAALAVLKKDSGVLVAPAGSGKTVMGCYIVMMRSRATLWLTHTKDLMHQSAERAGACLQGVGKVGLLGDGKRTWGDGKLIIATVQTLEKNPDLVEALKPLIGTVIIDEAHHFPAAAFIEVAGQFPAQYMYGLTATPERKDGLEQYLYKGVGPVLHTIDRDVLHKTGRLIKPNIRFVYTKFSKDQASARNDIDSVDAGGEEMDYVQLMADLIADEERAELVARNIVEYAKGTYSIVIAESVRYCYKLRDKVQEIFDKELYAYQPRMAVVHGGIAEYTWRVAGTEAKAKEMVSIGKAVDLRRNERFKRWEVKVAQYTPEEMATWQVTNTQRREILQLAADRQIDILFTTQLAREGLDLPHLSVGHAVTPKRGDAKGSTNGASVEQEIGRIQRPDRQNPSKVAYWIDYVDYNVGVFKDQYYSRRKVYGRLGLKVPAKPRDERDEAVEFLQNMKW